jgi:hypothetical protein
MPNVKILQNGKSTLVKASASFWMSCICIEQRHARWKESKKMRKAP